MLRKTSVIANTHSVDILPNNLCRRRRLLAWPLGLDICYPRNLTVNLKDTRNLWPIIIITSEAAPIQMYHQRGNNERFTSNGPALCHSVLVGLLHTRHLRILEQAKDSSLMKLRIAVHSTAPAFLQCRHCESIFAGRNMHYG